MREYFSPIDSDIVNCFCCNDKVDDFRSLEHLNSHPTDLCLKCYKLYKDNEQHLNRIKLLAKFIKRISYGSVTNYDLLDLYKPLATNVHHKILNSLYFSNEDIYKVKKFKNKLLKEFIKRGYSLRKRDMNIIIESYISMGWLCVFNSNQCYIDLVMMRRDEGI